MEITFTGHSLDVTPALRTFTSNKFDRLERHFAGINSVNVTFDVVNHSQIALATITVSGNEIHARSESSDMYAAIDALVDKLDRQLIKHKEKVKDHRDE